MAKNNPDVLTSDNFEDFIPSQSELQDKFSWLSQYWQIRNDYIDTVRAAEEGMNDIKFPVTAQYKTKVIHLGMLTSIFNEKISRYMSQPDYQVIINDPTDDDAVEKSSRLEKALNVISYEMERQGDGDVWNRILADVHYCDEGVYKMQLAPAPLWQDLVDDEKSGSKRYPKQSKEREMYKKENGVPLRRVYTPLENFYPSYDGPRLDSSFEVEGRLLSSCFTNKLFDRSVLEGFKDGNRTGSLQVPLLHYCTDEYYVTFATNPSLFSAGNPVRPENISAGSMQFLYGYKHGLGRSIYNCIAGRYGGWKTANNRIEGVNKVILGLNQAADEVASQVLTNIRAKYWPSLKFKINPELRGYTQGGKLPEAPKIKEGEELILYGDEDLSPIFQPQEDPSVPWIMDLIKDQLGKLGGSSVLYGQRQAGVDTGYHNAQQVSQAEHLDEKTEQHIVQGAIQDGTMIMLYARYLDEKLYAHYIEPILTGTRKTGDYVCVDPKDLYPLPRLDARVRKPRPIDFIASVRAARDASDDRQGKGPLLSDLSLRSELLARQSPDEEEKLIRIQDQKNKLYNSGVLDEKIAVALQLKLATNGVPPTGPNTNNADPALLAAAGQMPQNPQAQAVGGISPETQNNLNMPSGGVAVTDSQPEQRIGEAAMVAGGGSL